MRANPAGVEQGRYDKVVDGSESPVDCGGGCSVAALANLDLFEWGRVISTNLPFGTGKIVRNGSEVTVTVTWREQHTGEGYAEAGGGAEEASFAMTVEL